MKSRLTVTLFLSLCFFQPHAQERALGTWKMFLPYGKTLGLCNAGDKVFCAAKKSVFSCEKSTGIIQTYDKSTGLYDLDIKTIAYDDAANCLAIAYNNSNIDLVFNGTDVFNIPDIKIKSTTTTIGINGISFNNGNAYISTDIGISVLDLSKKETSNTYVIGANGSPVKVFGTCVYGNNICAATDEGLKYASLSSTNLQDFNSWILFDTLQGLPKKKATFVNALSNKLYAVIRGGNTDTLYEYDGTSWAKKFYSAGNLITSLSVTNNTVYFSAINTVSSYSGSLGKIDAAGNYSLRNSDGHGRPNGWFEDGNVSWESDADNGLYKNIQGSLERILPDGPYSSDVFKLESKDGVLYVAAGGVDDTWYFAFSHQGFYIYKDDKWINRNEYTDGNLSNYLDILAAAPMPAMNKTYFGSFFGGLVEFDNTSQNIIYYNKWNSLLEGTQGDTQRTKISAMAVDQYNNVWIGNCGATKPIKLIKPDGTWKEFATPYSFDLMKKIVIDQNNQLWAPLRGAANTGILVWSSNGTLDDPSDDVSRVLKAGAGSGGLPDPLVYSVAEDHDGNMWVGTNSGIAVYYCPGSVLTTNGCDADQIKVERDGYVGYLFGTEQVRTIVVDAANRKWIGTSNGLWLISADGKTELLKFTVDNSPLPNNQITDIAIDEKTGEVFIGTLGGLVSYQGDAIGDCSDCAAAIVYPNPVKPGYDGPIAIKGLAENAYVKITDVAGTLIYQGKANGSQMIWNGKGYNGNRAKSGVYLVFSSTDLGKEKRVGKILIAN